MSSGGGGGDGGDGAQKSGESDGTEEALGTRVGVVRKGGGVALKNTATGESLLTGGAVVEGLVSGVGAMVGAPGRGKVSAGSVVLILLGTAVKEVRKGGGVALRNTATGESLLTGGAVVEGLFTGEGVVGAPSRKMRSVAFGGGTVSSAMTRLPTPRHSIQKEKSNLIVEKDF